MDYVVLRDKQRGRSKGVQSGPVVRGLESFPPFEARIEVERTDARGGAELARDPEVVSAAMLMPTRLIEPRDVTADAGDGDAWGIAAVRADVCAFTGAGSGWRFSTPGSMGMLRAREAFGPGCVVVAAAGNASRRDISPD